MMKKMDIINKLNSSGLDAKRIIIISGASLVIHNVIEETPDIDIACDLDYYNSLDWPEKLGFFNVNIKYFDVFEISNNLYDENMAYDEIMGYRFMSLEECLKLKEKTNREKDKVAIQKLMEYLQKK